MSALFRSYEEEFTEVMVGAQEAKNEIASNTTTDRAATEKRLQQLIAKLREACANMDTESNDVLPAVRAATKQKAADFRKALQQLEQEVARMPAPGEAGTLTAAASTPTLPTPDRANRNGTDYSLAVRSPQSPSAARTTGATAGAAQTPATGSATTAIPAPSARAEIGTVQPASFGSEPPTSMRLAVAAPRPLSSPSGTDQNTADHVLLVVPDRRANERAAALEPPTRFERMVVVAFVALMLLVVAASMVDRARHPHPPPPTPAPPTRAPPATPDPRTWPPYTPDDGTTVAPTLGG